MSDNQLDDDYDDYDPPEFCWKCHGEQFLLIGCDEDEDWEEGWMNGDVIECPCCHGTGKAEDCTYW